ncbi:hypothetical protein NBG84_38510 [Streptomyces sp. CWNU-1]|uniref:Gram-positive cocci surface proteins LPxTG domain-containing protein n=2 Tax=Streptomyces albipurpureus TaxID=2897419 RepID=A0ABT0UZV5_9ACTN|nr:hypothetical protein [Streptomyces sp. CWNU-1]MCM2394098.1 hypothetical protein [Streptomyces sp. CWNU-1]
MAIALLGGSATTASAAPQPMGQCTTSSGAVLAVDFSKWGGPIYRSCGTTPTTGYELLNQGGWRTTGTGHDGPAFICRIGYSGHRGGKQFPPPEQDDCVLTPPASAYWSYWHADAGENTWEYSQLGAMLYKPKPGSVDLWIFGGTDIEGTRGRPAVTPDQLRARNTQPTGGGRPAGSKPTRQVQPPPPGVDTGPAPTRTRTVPAPTRKAPPSPSATTPAPASVSPSPPASPAPPPSPSIPATSPAAVAAPSSAKVVDAAPAADAEHDSGSFVPVVAAGGLVVVIGAAAAVAAKRRRAE